MVRSLSIPILFQRLLASYPLFKTFVQEVCHVTASFSSTYLFKPTETTLNCQGIIFVFCIGTRWCCGSVPLWPKVDFLFLLNQNIILPYFCLYSIQQVNIFFLSLRCESSCENISLSPFFIYKTDVIILIVLLGGFWLLVSPSLGGSKISSRSSSCVFVFLATSNCFSDLPPPCLLFTCSVNSTRWMLQPHLMSVLGIWSIRQLFESLFAVAILQLNCFLIS